MPIIAIGSKKPTGPLANTANPMLPYMAAIYQTFDGNQFDRFSPAVSFDFFHGAASTKNINDSVLQNTSNESGNAGIPVAWESMSLAEIERRVILASLRKFGTKREAADRLGVTSRTLANKLNLYGRAA